MNGELVLEDVKYNINKLKKLIEDFNNTPIPGEEEMREVKNIYSVSQKLHKLRRLYIRKN